MLKDSAKRAALCAELINSLERFGAIKDMLPALVDASVAERAEALE